MFGISFAKLLLLVAVVAAVWFGFKYLQARDQPPPVSRDRKPAPRGAEPPRPATATEDLVKCPVCATYVARGHASCGRPACPAG